MTKDNQIEIGQVFERWTVVGNRMETPRGERKWLCRCECGTERYVLERSLRYGTSKSCGCFRKEQIRKVVAISGIEGKTYGDLTVLHKAENQRKNGGIWWTCRCTCGNIYDVPGSMLVTGRKTRCNSNVHERNYPSANIRGKRFHRLVALYPLKDRDKRYSVMWHCRCDCGNEIDVAYNSLVYCNVRSCGCRKKEHDQKLREYLTHIAGTSLDIIKSQKIPTNNTTGTKGVYFIRGRWVAKIVFQKQAYYLGTFDNYEAAVRVRKEAEAQIREEIVAYYDRWKAHAEQDPEWADENPIDIQIEKGQDNTLRIHFSPQIA